ncbi:MAG: acetoacetate decarboxylase family protein [Victivallales bacterium]|nr:acetoacetate decarboxylase family protein [Victivallales bacterium]
MSYQFIPGKIYRMPTHFGPAPGPRQRFNGERYDVKSDPKGREFTVSFLTNKEQLEAMCPPGFEPIGEPVVTVNAMYLKEVEWLAGYGYNLLGVSFPARFDGKEDHLTGDLLLVLWENVADPMHIGREEIGYAKLYCDLPEPRICNGTIHCTASWKGFRFFDLKLNNMVQLSDEELKASQVAPSNDGVFHYKYIPKTEAWGEADASYPVMTPAAWPNKIVEKKWTGDGTIKFNHAEWEDLPTQCHVVNGLADLEIKEIRSATAIQTIGGKDLYDQRILR